MSEPLDASGERPPRIAAPSVPDPYLTEEQVAELQSLMSAWRSARERGIALPDDQLARLEGLIDVELAASARRAADIAQDIRP